MKFRLLKRLIGIGAIVTSATMIAGGGVGQAATTGTSPQFFTTQIQQFRATGSETTFYIMNEIQTLWSQASVYGCTLLSTDLRTCDTTKDGTATDTLDNYSRNEFINGLGNGSGNGIGQLCASKPTGGLTVDFARASRAPATSDGCSGTGGTTGLNFADDGVVGVVFPFHNQTTLTCASGDTCVASQVGPVAKGWRTSDPFAGPYTGTAFTNIDNKVANISLGGKSEAFRIYCDKGGRTTNADLTASTTTRSVPDASAGASGATTLTSASNGFLAADVNSEVTGGGLPAGDYITAVAAGGGSATIAVATTAAVSGVTVDSAALLTSPKNGTTGVGEFAAGDLNQTITGAGSYAGIPAGTTVLTFIDTAHILLSQDATVASTTAQVTLGGSGFAVNDWGQLTDPAHPISGTVTTLGTSIGAPIYIPAVNTGSGTYSTWKSYVGCDPNTKNPDGQIVQENDAPQLADVAGLGADVPSSDHPTDNIAAANQMAESLYYESYGVNQWHPYTYTAANDVEVSGVPTPTPGQSGLETQINGVSASPLNIKAQTFGGARKLYVVVRNDIIRGSVAGFINWLCDPTSSTHGLDLTTGKNYAAEITAQLNTVFTFPQIACGSASTPAISAPGGAVPSVTAALLNT